RSQPSEFSALWAIPCCSDLSVQNAARGCTIPLTDGRSGPLSSRKGENALFIEPHILHAPAVIGAVDHHRAVLDLRLPAGCLPRVINDGPHALLDHSPFDVPDDPLALFR